MSKPINDMSDEELESELEIMRSTKIPTQPLPKSPKRVGAKSDKPRRKSVFDQLTED